MDSCSFAACACPVMPVKRLETCGLGVGEGTVWGGTLGDRGFRGDWATVASEGPVPSEATRFCVRGILQSAWHNRRVRGLAFVPVSHCSNACRPLLRLRPACRSLLASAPCLLFRSQP